MTAAITKMSDMQIMYYGTAALIGRSSHFGIIIMDILFPYRGFHKGLGAEKQPANTTPYIQNMRVIDIQDNRFRGGQRPGLQKAYDQQIGGIPLPIVWLGSITIVD